MRTKLTEVGRVDLGDDDAVVVSTVHRSWSGADNEHSGRKAPTTTAPVAVEVRRHPYPGDLVGGVTAANARLLADLISRAADEADPDGAPRAGASTSRGR